MVQPGAPGPRPAGREDPASLPGLTERPMHGSPRSGMWGLPDPPGAAPRRSRDDLQIPPMVRGTIHSASCGAGPKWD
jgi:hypothetical protein